MPDYGPGPSPQDLQFQHAEPIPAEPSAGVCVACRQPAGAGYYQAQGHIVCPACVQRIQSGRQAPPALSLVRAALYGCAAALGGCLIYALVAIVLHAEVGLIAILVGWMVGKAIRHGSNGMGGRPQQILAVGLTYFAISTSYIPVMFYQLALHPPASHEQRIDGGTAEGGSVSPGALLLMLVTLAAAAPFLSLRGGFSAVISLFILFIGLQRAWKLTERTEIRFTGPYQADSPQ